MSQRKRNFKLPATVSVFSVHAEKYSFNDANYHQVPIPIPPINGHKNRRSRSQDQSKVVTIR